MPNEINENLSRPEDLMKEQKKINENLVKGFKNVAQDYVPVDLSLKENAQYRGQLGYEAEEATQHYQTINNLFIEANAGNLKLNASDVAILSLHKDRLYTEVLLNSQKFSGDSSEMSAVKTQVGSLERLLKESDSLDEGTLASIEDQYDAAITACRYYVEHKNPWFSTGIERKKMVEKTLKRIEKEKDLFVKAKDAYANGRLLDQHEITRPWQLLEYQIRDTDVKEYQKEKFWERVSKDAAVNEQFLKNLCGKNNERFEKFAVEALNKNPYLSEEDLRFNFFVNHFFKFETGKVDDDPIYKDFKLVVELERKYRTEKNEKGEVVKEGVVSAGTFSRSFTSALYIVKRDEEGKPLSKKEEEKEEWNKQFLDAVDKHYATITAIKEIDKEIKKASEKKAEAQKELDKAKTDNDETAVASATEKLNAAKAEEEAAVKKKEEAEKTSAENGKLLWLKFEDCYSRVLDDLYLPTAEEFKENPNFYEDLIKKDISLFYQLKGIVGLFEGGRNLGLGKYMDEYAKGHPDNMVKLSLLGIISMTQPMTLYAKHMCKSDQTVDEKAPYKVYMQQMDDPELSEEEKQEAKETYEAEMSEVKEEVDGFVSIYAACELEFEKMKNGSLRENQIGLYKIESYVTRNLKDELNSLKEQGLNLKPKVVEACMLMRNAFDYSKQPGYKELDGRLKEKNIDGEMSRTVGVLLKPVCRDFNSFPIDGEMKKNEEWNKKWLDIFDDETKTEEKKQMIEEHLTNLFTKSQLPSPQEIKAKGFDYFLAKDPLYYMEICKNVVGIDNMRNNAEFKPIVDAFLAANPERQLEFDMLVGFSSYVYKYLYMEGVDANKSKDDKLMPYLTKYEYDEEHGPDMFEYEVENLSENLNIHYGANYHKVMDLRANRKWKEDNLNPAEVQDNLEKTNAVHTKKPRTVEQIENQMLVKKMNKDRDKDLSAVSEKLEQVYHSDIRTALAAGYYYVKRDKRNKPINAEEERKEAHNKKWIAAWDRFATAQIRKEGERKAINEERIKRASKDIVNLFANYCNDLALKEQPDPEGLTEEERNNYLVSDPTLRYNLNHLGNNYMDMFKHIFPQAESELKKNVPGFADLNQKWTQMNQV